MSSGLARWWARRLQHTQGPVARRVRLGLAITVIALLPVSLLASMLAADEARHSIDAGFEQRLADLSKTAADQLDARLSLVRVAAEVLGRSSELQPGGTPGALYQTAWEIGRQLDGWVTIQSAGPGRPKLLTTGHAGPDPLQAYDPADARPGDRALRSLQPEVSDLLSGPRTGVRIIMVSVPSVQNGAARFIVNVVISPEQLSRVLAGLPLPPGAFATVADGNGVIIARSTDPDHRIGRPSSGWDKALKGRSVGLVKGVGLVGQENLFAVHGIPAAPSWRVAVAMRSDAAASVAEVPFRWVNVTRSVIGVLVLLGCLLAWINWRETRDSYRQLDRVLAQAPAGIAVSRIWPDGRFRREFLSRSAAAVVGWPHDELLRLGTLASLMDPDAVVRLRQAMVETLGGHNTTLEHQIRRADGAVRQVRAFFTLVERHQDGSGSVASCILDITELHLSERRLRLLEKLAVLGEVSSGIAHELNQPLAAIAMAAENGDRALARDPPNLKVAREKFVRISQQVHRVSAVIDHVRAFSRDDAGKAERLDIATVLHEVLILLEARLTASFVTLELDVPRHLPPVTAVGVLLEQAILNVIGNACDAWEDSGHEGPRIIRIRARDADGMLRLSIADAAGGIPEAILARIFDPFFTTKPVGKGTGLGLSISLAAIVEMGGQMTVHNENGGACFDIALPQAGGDMADLAEADSGHGGVSG
jgi:PAS domain S-box-containing protein